MLIAEILARYSDIGVDLLIDLVAILFMTYVLYFRRHGRTDLLQSYIALNLGIFVVMALLTKVRVDIAVGFGLFAILSIIRLRSSQVTQQEVAYYFVALVLGLINGLSVDDRGLVTFLNVVLLLALAIFDTRSLRKQARQVQVHLEHLYVYEPDLVAALERQLHGRVLYQEVTSMNFITRQMVVDVRYRPYKDRPPVEEQTDADDDVSGTVRSTVGVASAADGQQGDHGRHDGSMR